MFFIELSQRAQDFLRKLDSYISKRIEKRLKKLEDNAIPQDAKFITRDKSDKLFRYRIGNFRVLYKVKGKIVLVAKIDKRPRVYK